MNIRNLYLLVFFLILVVSCKKERPEPGSTGPEGTLKAVKTEVVVMEIALLKAENISFTAASYEASIGGQSVTLGADNSNGILAFLVPSLSEGSYKLTATIEGKEYTADYQIKTAVQANDPAAVISKTIDEITFTDTELDQIYNRMKGFEGNEHSLQHINTLKQYTQSVKQTIAGLDLDQQKQLAGFIAANPLIFAPAVDPTIYLDSFSFGKKKNEQTPEQLMDELFEKMEKDKNTLYSIAGLTVLSGVLGQPWLAAICGLGGIYKIYQINNSNIALLGKALVRFGEMLVDDISTKKKAPVFTFYKDRKYLIKVRSAYRNPNKLDMSSTAVLMRGVIISLTDIGNVWQQTNKFISRFGFGMDGEAYHIKNVNNTQSRIYNVNPRFIMLTNVSNGKVRVKKWEALPDGWEVEFTTDELTAQDFSFDVMYKSETGESVLKFEATLDPDNKIFGWYVGKYELQKRDTDDCSSQAGEKGDVYFYLSPAKLVTFTRSILAGMPETYIKNEGPFYPLNINDSVKQFRHIWQEDDAAEYRMVFELDYCNLYPGVKIESEEMIGGWATYYCADGTGCTNGFSMKTNYKFNYRIKTNATYIGENAPAGLSVTEIKKITEL